MTGFSEILGFMAASLTTASFVPQVHKTWRDRDTRSISLGMYLAFSLGVLCWMLYGIALMQWPIIIANAITLVLASTVLVLKLKHG